MNVKNPNQSLQYSIDQAKSIIKYHDQNFAAQSFLVDMDKYFWSDVTFWEITSLLKGHLPIVKLLIKNGLDILMNDGVILSILKNDEEIFNYLMNILYEQGKTFEINNEDDVLNLVDKYSILEKDSYVYPISYIYNPKAMIKHGFLPTSLKIDDLFFVEYVKGMDSKSFDFWFGKYLEETMVKKVKSQI